MWVLLLVSALMIAWQRGSLTNTPVSTESIEERVVYGWQEQIKRSSLAGVIVRACVRCVVSLCLCVISSLDLSEYNQIQSYPSIWLRYCGGVAPWVAVIIACWPQSRASLIYQSHETASRGPHSSPISNSKNVTKTCYITKFYIKSFLQSLLISF